MESHHPEDIYCSVCHSDCWGRPKAYPEDVHAVPWQLRKAMATSQQSRAVQAYREQIAPRPNVCGTSTTDTLCLLTLRAIIFSPIGGVPRPLWKAKERIPTAHGIGGLSLQLVPTTASITTGLQRWCRSAGDPAFLRKGPVCGLIQQLLHTLFLSNP